ncbi:MAG: hypothetical protein ABIG31_03990 [Candidatus Omnitrophota bacterium]
MLRKLTSLILSFGLLFQQTAFAQVAATELNLSGYLARMHPGMTIDKFRPVHLRYFSYDISQHNFKLLVEKGDAKNKPLDEIQVSAQDLLNYFLVGLTLHNESFWVNLRPDSQDSMIDDYLAQTDVGRIMLEADLQLKKDTAGLTSPKTPEGKEYWNRLYKKAEELFGNENLNIPALTRPWIVPGEIIIHETDTAAYVYKATLKVLLEQDLLKDSAVYNFKDPRLKALNEYSSELIRELIIPKLTKEVNSSKCYAGLRQVYYSLILSRWFKNKFEGLSGGYASRINTLNLTGLTSAHPWSKATYFKEYQKSFKDGEYNIQETVQTPTGQVIRSYFSGGIQMASSAINTQNGVQGGRTDTLLGLLQGNASFYGNVKDGITGTSSPMTFQLKLNIKEHEELGRIDADGDDIAWGQVPIDITDSKTAEALTSLIQKAGLALDKGQMKLGAEGAKLLIAVNEKREALIPAIVLDRGIIIELANFPVDYSDYLTLLLMKSNIAMINFDSERHVIKFPAEVRIANSKNGSEVIINFENSKNEKQAITAIAQESANEHRLDILYTFDLPKVPDEFKSIIGQQEAFSQAALLDGMYTHIYLKDSPETREFYKSVFPEGKLPEAFHKEQIQFIAIYAEMPTDVHGEPRIRDVAIASYQRGQKQDKVMYIPLAEEKYVDGWIDTLINLTGKKIEINPIPNKEGTRVVFKNLFLDGEHISRAELNELITDEVIRGYPYIPGSINFEITHKAVDNRQLPAFSMDAPVQDKGAGSPLAEEVAGLSLAEKGKIIMGDIEIKSAFSLLSDKLIYHIVRWILDEDNMKERTGSFWNSVISKRYLESLNEDETKKFLVRADRFMASMKFRVLLQDEILKVGLETSEVESEIVRDGNKLPLNSEKREIIKDSSGLLASAMTLYFREKGVFLLNDIIRMEQGSTLTKLKRFISGYATGFRGDEIDKYVKQAIMRSGNDIYPPQKRFSAGSPVQETSAKLKAPETTGGIDFRTLPMTIKPMGSFEGLNMRLPQLSPSALMSFNISQEIEQLNQMVSRGIIPSGARVQELVSACLQKGQLQEHQGEILTILAETCKLQEGECCESSEELKIALVAANAV